LVEEKVHLTFSGKGASAGVYPVFRKSFPDWAQALGLVAGPAEVVAPDGAKTRGTGSRKTTTLHRINASTAASRLYW
jgi:hypothetical protein